MNPSSTTLVIARYNEDLEWISEIPEHFKVIVYNKGPLIESLTALRRAQLIETRDNRGRESETYLHHMISRHDDGNEWTVFCQGDPFEHSPDFLELLKCQDRWKDIQPLTYRWRSDLQIPPPYLLESHVEENLKGLRVRPETFSLFLWTASRFTDHGSLSHRDHYGRIHDLPSGANLASHFFTMAGLPDIACAAGNADCGRFCYGAIYAVKTRLVKEVDPASKLKLLEMAQGDPVYGYILERLWLHLFGEPFLSLAVS